MAEQGNAPTVTAKFPDLAGQAAIVTGTSRGIGAGIAEFLGRQGMRVAMSARSADAGEAVAARLRAAGVDCLFMAADLSTPDGARQVFEAAVARFGRIHLLVNNAAYVASVSFLKLDEQAYHKVFEANMRMIYGPSFLVAHHMVESGGGNIIHISSVGGTRAHRGMVGYDASKGGIEALTRAMALELAPHKIRVNAIAPGLILTRVIKPEWAERFRQKEQGIPLGRAGTSEDVAAMVAFLASDAAAYVTGQVVYVDGGLTTQLTPPGIYI